MEPEGAVGPMSKDMKGMPELDGRGGRNGAVGRRLWGMVDPPAAVGFPAEGKTTGGTGKSLAMELLCDGWD